LIVGFAASLVACQYIGSFSPDLVFPVALQTDHVPLTPYAPGVGAPDQRFSLPFLPSALHAPASYRIWLKHSPRHKRSASACGIDGLHEFPIFPLPTPTRTSLASFEPLLILLTCRSSSLDPPLPRFPPLPRVGPGQFQEAPAQWYSVLGSLDLSS